jgi:hypothetical protein
LIADEFCYRSVLCSGRGTVLRHCGFASIFDESNAAKPLVPFSFQAINPIVVGHPSVDHSLDLDRGRLMSQEVV